MSGYVLTPDQQFFYKPAAIRLYGYPIGAGGKALHRDLNRRALSRAYAAVQDGPAQDIHDRDSCLRMQRAVEHQEYPLARRVGEQAETFRLSN